MKLITIRGNRPQVIKTALISKEIRKNYDFIITDSGGLQKETYWAGVPCYTLGMKQSGWWWLYS